MRFLLATLLIALFVALAYSATTPETQNPYVVSYPKGTPYKVMQDTMDAIRAAGGVVTHEYKLIMGFAAKAPAGVMKKVHALGEHHKVVVEDDGKVSVAGS